MWQRGHALGTCSSCSGLIFVGQPTRYRGQLTLPSFSTKNAELTDDGDANYQNMPMFSSVTSFRVLIAFIGSQNMTVRDCTEGEQLRQWY